MNKFNKLYTKIIEEMLAGGGFSIFGSPAGGEVGSHGGQVGNTDFWNTNNNTIANSLFKKTQKRNLNFNKKSNKRKNKNK